MISRNLPVLCVVGLLGCGAAQQTTSSRTLTAHDYYPMAEGAQWSYDIDDGVDPVPVFATMRVDTVEGNRSVIRNVSDETSTYERRAEGIFHVEGDVWLLRDPIAIGREWPGLGGRTARIVAIDERVETPSGNYEGCVRVEERGGEDGRVIATVYCPDTGMTFQRASISLEHSMTEASVTVRLRGYLPGVEE